MPQDSHLKPRLQRSVALGSVINLSRRQLETGLAPHPVSLPVSPADREGTRL